MVSHPIYVTPLAPIPANPLGWSFMRGMPYLVPLMAGLPRSDASASRLGADMAGSAGAAGNNLTELRPGEFGGLAWPDGLVPGAKPVTASGLPCST